MLFKTSAVKASGSTKITLCLM